MTRGAGGRSVITAGLACAGLIAAAVASPAAAAPYDDADARAADAPLVYIDELVREVPNAVAVANDGIIAASLFDDQSVALVKGPGEVVYVPLNCSPADVAIHPDATIAWAVCPGDPHLRIIDVASAQVSVASLDLRQGDDVVYLPGPDRLVIADLEGEILLTTGHDGYQVLARVSADGLGPTVVTALADATRAYAVTVAGQLLSVDFARETVTRLTGQGPDVILTSVSLSRSGTSLYATGLRGSNDTWQSSVMRLDPVTGRILQEVPLDFTDPGTTSMSIAAGHRSASVATGLAIDADGLLTGGFDVAIDDQGTLGGFTPLTPAPYFGSDVARSGDGGRAALGITNSRVAGMLLEDQPYPPSITLQGRLAKGAITLGGTTTSLQPGTRLTVHVKDAARKDAPFVRQAVRATVDARGAFTWKGTTRLKRIQVFVSGPASASPTVTLPRSDRHVMRETQ